jgi:hypothetical protein
MRGETKLSGPDVAAYGTDHKGAVRPQDIDQRAWFVGRMLSHNSRRKTIRRAQLS